MDREMRCLTAGVDRYVLKADRDRATAGEPVPFFLLRPPKFYEMARLANLWEREGNLFGSLRQPNIGDAIAYACRTCLTGWGGVVMAGKPVPFVGSGRVGGGEPTGAAEEDLDHLEWVVAVELAERVKELMGVTPRGLS